MEKRDISYRQENAIYSAPFWVSSHYGSKNRGIIPLRAKLKANIASLIPSILGCLEVK